MFLVCLHGYLCHLLMHLGILLLLALLLTCFTNGRRLSLQSCDWHLRFSSKLLSAALNWQSATCTDKLSAFMLTHSIFFFLTSKKIWEDYWPHTEDFYCTGKNGTKNFVSTYYFPFPHTVHICLRYMKKSIWLFFTLKYLYQTTSNDYLTIKSRCISTDVTSSRYFCNYS